MSRYSVSNPNPVVSRIFGLTGSGSGILLSHPALDPSYIKIWIFYTVYLKRPNLTLITLYLLDWLPYIWTLLPCGVFAWPSFRIFPYPDPDPEWLENPRKDPDPEQIIRESGSSTLIFLHKFCGEKSGSGYGWQMNQENVGFILPSNEIYAVYIINKNVLSTG